MSEHQPDQNRIELANLLDEAYQSGDPVEIRAAHALYNETYGSPSNTEPVVRKLERNRPGPQREFAGYSGRLAVSSGSFPANAGRQTGHGSRSPFQNY